MTARTPQELAVLRTEFSSNFAIAMTALTTVEDLPALLAFVEGMENRMIVSYYKYGSVSLAYPHRVNAIDSLRQRVAKYHETHNTEWLMDAANFAMIEHMHSRYADATWFLDADTVTPDTTGAPPLFRAEAALRRYEERHDTGWLVEVGVALSQEFMRSQYPDAHFAGTDSDQSPGRVTSVGTSDLRNDELPTDQQVRQHRAQYGGEHAE